MHIAKPLSVHTWSETTLTPSDLHLGGSEEFLAPIVDFLALSLDFLTLSEEIKAEMDDVSAGSLTALIQGEDFHAGALHDLPRQEEYGTLRVVIVTGHEESPA